MELNEYKKMYENEETNWWFVSRRLLVQNFLKKYAKGKKISILDVGCGTGINMVSFKKFGNITGCDMSKKAIEFCKKRGITSVSQRDATSLRFSKKFDVVLAMDLLEHVKNDTKALREFSKVLKNNGILILTVPANKFLWSRHDTALHHFRRYSLKEIKNKVENMGFEIDKLSYWIITLFPLIFIYRMFDKFIKRGGTKTSITPGFMNGILMFISNIERKFIEYNSFPFFGVSIVCIVKKRSY